MTKILAFFAFLIPTLSANAQLQKGTLMAGGTGFFSAGGGSTGFYGGLTLNPRVGLFLTDRLVAGAGVGLGFSVLGRDDEGSRHFYSGSVSPFARYYFSPAAGTGEVPKGLVPFAEIGGGVSAGIFRQEKYTGVNGYGMVGINKFFNKHVALEVDLSYSHQSSNFSSSPYRSGPLGGGIGLQIFLNRGKKKSTPAASPSDK